MVETLAAFTILIILSLSFLACIHFAGKMSGEADDRRKASMRLDQMLARTSGGFSVAVQEGGVVLKNLSDEGSLTYPDISSQSKVYMLKFPADDPKVCVMRFEK